MNSRAVASSTPIFTEIDVLLDENSYFLPTEHLREMAPIPRATELWQNTARPSQLIMRDKLKPDQRKLAWPDARIRADFS